MAARDVVWPLAIALLIAVPVAVLGPRYIDTRPPPPELWEKEAARGYVWPFGHAVGDNATFLLVAPQGAAAAEKVLDERYRMWFGDPKAPAHARLKWLSPNLATYTAPGKGICFGAPDNYCHLDPYPEVWLSCCPSNATAVQVTVYVFRLDGTLLGSNADANGTARFRHDDHYVELPRGWWALDPRRLPPDAQALPPQWWAVVEPLAANLTRAPVGAVGTALVPSHPYVGAVGPLVVTLRVEARAEAPA